MDPRRERDEGDGGRPLLRLFFAVELAPPARAAAARTLARLREATPARVRWVAPENLHVTLRFLGAVAEDRITGLVARVAAELAPLHPFPLRLGAVRAFPSPRRPRVVALEVGPEAPLVALAEAVERGVVAAGLPPEPRPFRAHLTLGRLAQATRRLEVAAPAASHVTASDTAASEAHEDEVTEVVLIHSQLQRSGSPRYTPLARLPLGPPPERAAPP